MNVQERIEKIEELENDNRISKEMLKAELENDVEYTQTASQAKEINTKKKNLKDEILNQEENKKLVEKIKENTEEIDTLKEILTAELLDIYQKQNTDQVTGLDGVPRKFKLSVRLMPKRFQ